MGGNHGYYLSYVCKNWPWHMPTAVHRRNEAGSTSGHKSLDRQRRNGIASLYTDIYGSSSLGGKKSTRRSWSLKASALEGISLSTPRLKAAQLVNLPGIIKNILNPVKYVKGGQSVLQGIRNAVAEVFCSPGAYIERQCWKCMGYIERICRQVSKEAHIIYLKGCNLGIPGLLTLGQDPVENIIRVIALSYLIEWFTKSNYLKVHYDLNPMAIFTKCQYYRLLTSLFLHNGIVHMLQNVRSLMALGSETIRLLGTTRMITTYLVSGVVGNYISYVYHFAYRNRLPADVFNVAQSVVQGVGQTGKSTYNVVEHVIDRIRGRQEKITFPVFLMKYLNTSLCHVLESGVKGLLPHAYKSRQYATSSDIDSTLQSYIKRKTLRQRGCGASSAIYGLMGAICAYHIRFGNAPERKRIFEIVTTAIMQNLMVFAGANVDHVSHFFGFITGLCLTLQM